jgi:undecaprenyl-diphosphatase
MTIFESILLGIVQGVFMFFPVSSTAHMVLLSHWLNGPENLLAPQSPQMILYYLVVHVGTLVSIAIVFRKDLTKFVRDFLADTHAWRRGERALGDALYLRLALLGGVSVVITGVIGLTFKSTFETVFGHPLTISGTLALTGILLYFTDTVGPRPRGLRQLTLWVAIVIGLAQAFALVPGLSRSGMTIAFALFVGLKRRWAAQYSFFIAFPTILGATMLHVMQLFDGTHTEPIDIAPMILPLIVGFIVAAVVGVASLYLVITLLYRARFRYFSYYIWGLAAFVALNTWGEWIDLG